MAESTAEGGADGRSGLERALGIVTEVRAGEGPTALLLALNVFLLLTAYYVIKPVREGLILAMPNGPEYKAYLGGAIAVALLGAVPAYGRAADSFRKNKLVIYVTLFFASHLVVFYALSHTGLKSQLGLVFFVWVGIFNMMLVAQFWAFANHMYTEEQGKRLFALIGIGASLGGVVGSYGVKVLARTLGTYQLMLLSAAVLCGSAALTHVASKRESAKFESAKEAKADKATPVVDKKGTFALVFRHKYLLFIAIFSLLFTFVNTNGEYMLGSVVKAEAATRAAAEAAAGGGEVDKLKEDITTAIYGDFFLWVNVVVMVVQTFLVSRIVKWGGLRVAFFILPVIALLDAIGIALAPVLTVVRIGKVAENGTDYSVNNTVRNMLWLPTTTEMKFKAKQATDTFFVRMGDVANGVLVGLAGKALGVRGFAAVNIGLVAVWVFVAIGIVRENAKLTAEKEEREGKPAGGGGAAEAAKAAKEA